MSSKRRRITHPDQHMLAIAKEMTDLATAKARNSAEYMTVMTTLLGNGVAAMAREKSDLEFETMLQIAITVTIETAEYARARIASEGFMETKH